MTGHKDYDQSRTFKAVRLKLARELSGKKISELADELGITRQYLSNIESGKAQPSGILLTNLADNLGVTPGFLCTPLFTTVEERECHFRRRKTARQWEQDQAKAFGIMVLHLVQYIEAHLGIQESNLPPQPDIKSFGDVENAAENCRRYWELTINRPLKSVARVLETCASAFIAQYQTSTGKLDAFSFLKHRGIVIRSNFKSSSSRARFDFGHELGHLIMHRGVVTGDDLTERQADRFAGALIVPREAFLQEFPRSQRWNWEALINMKRKWGIALAAIVYRARDLNLIDEEKFKTGITHVKRTWGNNEPFEPHPDEPVFLKMALQRLIQKRGISYYDVSIELGWTSKIFDWVTGLNSEVEKAKEAQNTVSLPF